MQQPNAFYQYDRLSTQGDAPPDSAPPNGAFSDGLFSDNVFSDNTPSDGVCEALPTSWPIGWDAFQNLLEQQLGQGCRQMPINFI